MIDVLQLLILSIFTSFVSMGVYLVCNAENNLILSFIGKWYENLIVKRKLKYKRIHLENALHNDMRKQDNYAERYYWLVNPLFYCPYCVSSFWSALIYLIFVPLTRSCLYEIPLQIFAVLTFNSLFIKILYPNGI